MPLVDALAACTGDIKDRTDSAPILEIDHSHDLALSGDDDPVFHVKIRTHATLTLPGIPIVSILESLPAEKTIHAGFIVTNVPAIDT